MDWWRGEHRLSLLAVYQPGAAEPQTPVEVWRNGGGERDPSLATRGQAGWSSKGTELAVAGTAAIAELKAVPRAAHFHVWRQNL